MHSMMPQANASLATWFNYLRGRYDCRIVLGIDKLAQVAQSLSLTKRLAPLVITVTGTNGKGTTCCVLEAIFIAAGYRVGVYSSPHLLRYTERIRIQNQELAESAYTAAFAVVERARGEAALTFFEYTTLVALQMFSQAALDVMILEVGLGGRLDAVNIVDADIAVITTVALDHTEWLGNDRESIGREKAGIFRTGAPAVIGEPEVPLSITEIAQRMQVPLFCREVDWHFKVYKHHWRWHDNEGIMDELPLPRVPISNAATALAALRCSPLPISRAALLRGLSQVSLPGRFQIVKQSPTVILDVAHNPQAAAYLGEQLQQTLNQQPAHRGKPRALHAVVGMFSDKDIAKTLCCLKSQVHHWYCAPLTGPRTSDVQALLNHLPSETKVFSCITQAWQRAMQQAEPQDTVVVFGSFHAVAPILHCVNEGI